MTSYEKFSEDLTLEVQILLRLWGKNFLTEMYKNIQTLHFKLFKNAVLGRQEMVQCKCFFWHQAEYVCWKICWKGFWMCCGSILFSISSEFRFIKWVSFFKQNWIVKWVIFFANFCWLCDFLLKNLKSKKNTLMMSTGTRGRI